MPSDQDKLDAMIGLSLRLAELEEQYTNAGRMVEATLEEQNPFGAAGADSMLGMIHGLTEKIQQAISAGVLCGAIDGPLGSKASARVQRVSIGCSMWKGKLQKEVANFPETDDPTTLPPMPDRDAAPASLELDPAVEFELRALLEDLPILDDFS